MKHPKIDDVIASAKTYGSHFLVDPQLCPAEEKAVHEAGLLLFYDAHVSRKGQITTIDVMVCTRDYHETHGNPF